MDQPEGDWYLMMREEVGMVGGQGVTTTTIIVIIILHIIRVTAKNCHEPTMCLPSSQCSVNSKPRAQRRVGVHEAGLMNP